MPIAAATLMLAALLLMLAAVAAPAAAAAPSASRVLIVLAPYLTWDDVAHGPMPATRAIAASGLISDMNVRSGALGAGAPTLPKGALLLSAGTSVVSDAGAYGAYDATETVDGGDAGTLYRRIFGHGSDGSRVVYLGTPRQVSANIQTSTQTRIGALGGAVRAAGGTTAAIGNSDPGLGLQPADRSRPAGIIAADEEGRVDRGRVSADSLLRQDETAPFGVRTDVDALLEAYASATKVSARGPELVVVDPGDLSRVYDWASVATTATTDALRHDALKRTDRIVEAIDRTLSPGDLLVVLAPTVAESPDKPSGFAPLIMHGAGMTGLARTASTHRDGICTIMDVSATVVDALGLTPPSEMVGSRITGTGPGASLESRLSSLTAMNDTAIAVEQVRSGAINWFVTSAVVVLIGTTLLLLRGAPDVPPIGWSVARWLLVLVLCIPAAGLLEYVLWSRPPSAGWVVGLLVGACVALWAVAMLVARGKPTVVPVMVVTGVTTAVLLIDQWLGAPLSFATLFGFAPLYGARYYGIGNEMAGLLLGSAMVFAALALDRWPDAAWVRPFRRWGWLVLGVVALGTTAAPPLGANIGAVAWMTVGFATGWLMLNGKRVWTWRNAVALVVVVALIVAGLAAVDLLGGSGSETHLGRAISSAEGGGGFASVLTLVARKAETNIRVFGRTNWTWLLVAVLLLLGYLRWRPRGEFADMLHAHPAFSAVLGAALFAGVVGNFTEDSGVIIPALIMLPVGVAALVLMLDGRAKEKGERP